MADLAVETATEIITGEILMVRFRVKQSNLSASYGRPSW